MKHRLRITCLFFLQLVSVFALGQEEGFHFSSREVGTRFRADLERESLHLEMNTQLHNPTEDTLRLYWRRSSINVPPEWETQVCFDEVCYLPQIYGNYDPLSGVDDPLVVPPRGEVRVSLLLYPNGVAGNGSYDLELALSGAFDDASRTATFLADVGGTRQAGPIPSMRLFPNPANHFFELENGGDVDRIELYNLLGKRVKSFRASPDQRYNIFTLPAGIYLVSLINEREGVLRTLRLSKQSTRP